MTEPPAPIMSLLLKSLTINKIQTPSETDIVLGQDFQISKIKLSLINISNIFTLDMLTEVQM